MGGGDQGLLFLPPFAFLWETEEQGPDLSCTAQGTAWGPVNTSASLAAQLLFGAIPWPETEEPGAGPGMTSNAAFWLSVPYSSVTRSGCAEGWKCPGKTTVSRKSVYFIPKEGKKTKPSTKLSEGGT